MYIYLLASVARRGSRELREHCGRHTEYCNEIKQNTRTIIEYGLYNSYESNKSIVVPFFYNIHLIEGISYKFNQNTSKSLNEYRTIIE